MNENKDEELEAEQQESKSLCKNSVCVYDIFHNVLL